MNTTAGFAASTVLLLLAGWTADAASLQIDWRDLVPPGQDMPAPQKITAAPSAEMPDIALTRRFSGRAVRLSGYLLPADREGDLVYSFMLVPRSGACSHMAQPPASQVVRVVPEKPYRLSMNYEPVSVTGTLSAGLEKTQLFILDGTAVILSGYKISKAAVERDPNAALNKPVTPWRFLDTSAFD
ncbi:DUF3299 domain-containing protein [Chelativorans sp. AA-79]|uniref:DUF3299 domain-containing protein n=1 Tax=Chelativorans sp. AA-79 TaxID=3028735 RepID=UPI0023F99812|nr:DUF3299 domain-containing protein [Chelativorans sp. AA-79]WEX07242.1 DUF3299 domain-containing protein [Chelativorans sp. AA-79]